MVKVVWRTARCPPTAPARVATHSSRGPLPGSSFSLARRGDHSARGCRREAAAALWCPAQRVPPWPSAARGTRALPCHQRPYAQQACHACLPPMLLPSTIQAPITTEAVDALLEYGQQVRGPCQKRAGSAFGQPALRRLVSAPDHVPEAAPGSGQPRPTRLLGPRWPGHIGPWSRHRC